MHYIYILLSLLVLLLFYIIGNLPELQLCNWTSISNFGLGQNYLYVTNLSSCFCHLPVLLVLDLFLNDIYGMK